MSVEDSGEREATPQSRVTVDFVPEGTGTRLTVCHEGVQTTSGRDGVKGGWTASFQKLAALVSKTQEEEHP